MKEIIFLTVFAVLAISVSQDVNSKLNIIKEINADTMRLMAEYDADKRRIKGITTGKVERLMQEEFSDSQARRAATICGSVLFSELDNAF